MAEKRPFRAYEGREPYIFVSYSHKDSAKVYPIIEKLFLSGYNIWYDQGIPNNALLDMEIARHITRCAVFVVFLSRNSSTSQYVIGKELPQATRRRRQIIRVALDGGDYSAIKGGADVSAEMLAGALPPGCRSCERRDPAPIMVDLSQGIDIKTEKLDGFEYFIGNGQLYLSNFYLTEGFEELREEGRLDITVPERLAGFPVNIGEGAFSGQDAGEIVSITLPDSMEEIGESAFEEASFESIHLPERLKVISAGLFEECKYLRHVDIPYGVERIEQWAFDGCEELDEIIIPETVKTIDYNAFGECASLRRAVIAPGTVSFEDEIFPDVDHVEDLVDEDEGETMEDIDLDDVFHIVCVEGSAAHEYAKERDLFFRLISAEEMEEKYQKPMRERHEQAVKTIESGIRDDILARMISEDGAYACLVARDDEYEKLSGIVMQLAADGYRVRRGRGTDSAEAKNCAVLMPMLSASSVSDKAYIKALARSGRRTFPLMLDSSAVPEELADRFIMHISDRTDEDLLNEIREFLSKNGCRGNPRAAESMKEQYVDLAYDYEVDEDGDVTLSKYKGEGGIVYTPSVMYGRQVTSLRANLFKDRKDVYGVVIGSGTKFIGQHAFQDCTGLREITLPPSVENIASEAFLRCSPKLLFRAARKSAAAQFAKKNGFKVKYTRFKKVR